MIFLNVSEKYSNELKPFLNAIFNTYELLLNKLNLLNPLNILSKGYSVVKLNNIPIKSTKEIKEKDKLNIRLHEGELEAIVERIKE